MKFNIVFLAVAFLVVVLSDAYRNQFDKHELIVLYESKCPDSLSFITKQLQPTYALLQNYITVRFVAYGHSEYSAATNKYTCQHGPEECLGNIVQNCALYYMKDRPSDAIEYIACEMVTQYSTKRIPGCIHRWRLPLNDINKCVSSQLGVYLLLAAEGETRKYSPVFIPTVVFNGVFTQEFQDLAQYDLMDAICSRLTKVPECSETYSSPNNTTRTV